MPAYFSQNKFNNEMSKNAASSNRSDVEPISLRLGTVHRRRRFEQSQKVSPALRDYKAEARFGFGVSVPQPSARKFTSSKRGVEKMAPNGFRTID